MKSNVNLFFVESICCSDNAILFSDLLNHQDKKNLTITSTTTPIKDIIIKITNILQIIPWQGLRDLNIQELTYQTVWITITVGLAAIMIFNR